MDLTAELNPQTVETVFVKHELPKGEMTHRDKPVDLAPIRRAALLTVEGEKDDISGVGQTKAATGSAHIPADKKAHYLQPGVGHYGVFNGSRFRSEIAPRIADFMLSTSAAARARKAEATVAAGGLVQCDVRSICSVRLRSDVNASVRIARI